MAKVEVGRSHLWVEQHCSICKKKFINGEQKFKGHAVFDDGIELDFLACEKCAKECK